MNVVSVPFAGAVTWRSLMSFTRRVTEPATSVLGMTIAL